jgi:hypothetical protein
LRERRPFSFNSSITVTWICIFLTIGPLGISGCTLLSGADHVDGYQTQKRIVWQGTLTVDRGPDIVRLIYFGYDRNRDLKRLTERAVCRGVDVLDYKYRLPDGRWEYRPFLVIVDDNFDCYGDRALWDCDGDGVFEGITDIAGQGVLLEFVNPAHRGLLEAACPRFRPPR